MPKLLIVAGDPLTASEGEVVRAFNAANAFELLLTLQPSVLPRHPLGLIERAYRALDRRLFERSPSASLPVAAAGEIASLVHDHRIDAVIDLTNTLEWTPELSGLPLIRLSIDGRPVSDLAEATRQCIGTPQGSVRIQALWAQSSTVPPVELFHGRCYIDHRSLIRSIGLVAHKLPMFVQAALQRHARDQLVNSTLARPESKATPATAMQLLRRLLTSVVQRVSLRVHWRVVLYRAQSRYDLTKPWVELQPNKAALWADPFVIPHPGGVAVFFEELPYASNVGRISLIDVDHQGRQSHPKAILDRPWHLSYPYVFEWRGKRYMMPESSANKTLDLYECIRFPDQWTLAATLISGVSLADASIVEWQGRLWMFAAHAQAGASNYDELNLYWASDLLGTWTAHPLNPVKIDASSARPAGAPFVEDGRLLRPTQDCRNRYGDAVSFQEVLMLSDTQFEERTLETLSPGGIEPGDAVHTYNQSGGFVAIDSARWVRRF